MSGNVNRVTIVTNNINCERHTQYYSTIEKYFILNNWSISTDFNVDKVIITGCGFHDFMYDKVRKTVESIKNSGIKEENIIIMGCSTKTHEQDLQSEFNGKVIGIHKENELDQIINASVPFSDIDHINLFNFDKVSPNSQKNEYFFIKIAEGCLQQCNFCVIKKAKGYIKSKATEEITSQYKFAVENGYKKIFLMGEDTFAYGVDSNRTIIELIDELLEIDSNVELYFGSLHCRWLLKYADDLLRLCKKGVIKTIHMGLQHVNDAVLKRMGRVTEFNDIYNVISKIKKECPQITFSADIMVGFPGESQSDFKELIEFFKNDTCFSMIQHFGYSDIKGAPSTGFDGKVPTGVVGMRWNYLTEVLGSRSAYAKNSEPEYQLTHENNYFICKDTFREPGKSILYGTHGGRADE